MVNSSSKKKRKTSIDSHLKDAAPWNVQGTYLVKGWRPPSYSIPSSLFTGFFHFHNETVNVYTHALAALYFLLQYNDISARMKENGTVFDLFTFRLYIIAVSTCFGMSGIYHAMSNHSKELHDKLLRWDMRCIAFLVCACYYPACANALYCFPQYMYVFLSIVTILAVAVVIFPAFQWFNDPHHGWVRTGVYGALGGFGVIPTCTTYILQGHDRSVEHIVAIMFCYLMFGTGALIYAVKFPEVLSLRWKKLRGMFDHAGASHQLFHLSTIAGTSYLLNHLLYIQSVKMKDGCAWLEEMHM